MQGSERPQAAKAAQPNPGPERFNVSTPTCRILAAAMLVASTPAALAAARPAGQRGSAGQQADSISEGPEISGTGRFVAFESQATNLAAGTSERFDQSTCATAGPGTTQRWSA